MERTTETLSTRGASPGRTSRLGAPRRRRETHKTRRHPTQTPGGMTKRHPRDRRHGLPPMRTPPCLPLIRPGSGPNSSRRPRGRRQRGGPARDQIVDAQQPDAEPGTQSGVPADETVDGPAGGARTVVRGDQSSDAAPAPADAAASVSAPDGSLLPADMDATFQNAGRRSNPVPRRAPRRRRGR